MAEMAIVTAMRAVEAMVTVEATAAGEEEEEAVGQLPMVRETTTVGIEVGRASTILGLSAAATEGTEGEVEATIVGMMGARPVRTTGLFHYQGTTGLSTSCFRVAMDPRVSTLIGTRTFRSRPLDLMCPMA